MNKNSKSMYDYMKEADKLEEDAICPEEWIDDIKRTERERYFEYYDDIKTSIKEDW
jgi:hypothetical protein